MTSDAALDFERLEVVEREADSAGSGLVAAGAEAGLYAAIRQAAPNLVLVAGRCGLIVGRRRLVIVGPG